MTELRVYLPIEDLQPQFAAYMSTPMRARGYPPMQGDNSLIIEVAPALSIHRIVDLALKAAPDMEPGILFTERQFGEFHKGVLARSGSVMSLSQTSSYRASGWLTEGIWKVCSASLNPKGMSACRVNSSIEQCAIPEVKD